MREEADGKRRIRARFGSGEMEAGWQQCFSGCGWSLASSSRYQRQLRTTWSGPATVADESGAAPNPRRVARHSRTPAGGPRPVSLDPSRDRRATVAGSATRSRPRPGPSAPHPRPGRIPFRCVCSKTESAFITWTCGHHGDRCKVQRTGPGALSVSWLLLLAITTHRANMEIPLLVAAAIACSGLAFVEAS
eukprot:364853-Chlamydomonas_euryale.AAC.6